MRKTFVSLFTFLVLLMANLGSVSAQAPQPGPPAPVPAPKPCDCDCCKEAKFDAPTDLKVCVGRDHTLTINCDKTVTIVAPDEDDDITVTPSFVNNTFNVKCYEPGTYSVVAAVISKGKIVYCRIKVTAVVKPPKPQPGPAPAPTPGPSPAPTPAPAPLPTDPLAKDLQSAYTLDTTADKADQTKALAALYRQGADKVKDAETGSKLLSDMKAVALAMKIPDAAIPLVRSRIGVELKKVLVAGALSDAQKTAAKALFLQIADGLAACK